MRVSSFPSMCSQHRRDLRGMVFHGFKHHRLLDWWGWEQLLLSLHGSVGSMGQRVHGAVEGEILSLRPRGESQ